MGAILRLLRWVILLPVRIVRTAFKVGQFAACLISLIFLAAFVLIALLVLYQFRGH